MSVFFFHDFSSSVLGLIWMGLNVRNPMGGQQKNWKKNTEPVFDNSKPNIIIHQEQRWLFNGGNCVLGYPGWFARQTKVFWYVGDNETSSVGRKQGPWAKRPWLRSPRRVRILYVLSLNKRSKDHDPQSMKKQKCSPVFLSFFFSLVPDPDRYRFSPGL